MLLDKLNLTFKPLISSKYLKRPMNIIMCLEEACNLHCIQCDIWKTRVPKIKMSLEDRKKIILKIKSWLGDYTLNFFAGEPLLHPQMLDLISFASKHTIRTIITSNATMLSEVMVKKLIESGLTSMFISIDGAKSQTHNLIRGYPNVYRRAVTGLKTLLKVRGKRKSPKLYIESLVMNKNYSELPHLARWAKKIGADGIVFQPVTSKYGFGNNAYNQHWFNSNDSLLPKYSEVKPVMEAIISLKQKDDFVANPLYHLNWAISYFKNPEKFSQRGQCQAHNNFVITDEGKIMMCFSQKVIGNAFKDDYSNVWSSNLANEVRHDNKSCVKTSKIILCNSLSLASMFGLPS